MVDVVTQTDNVIQNEEKIYKTKDYVRRANNKYRKKKYAEDLEYRQKQLECCKQSLSKNPEKYKEYKKNYMREYRARKKLEKEQANTENTQDDPVKQYDIITKISDIVIN